MVPAVECGVPRKPCTGKADRLNIFVHDLQSDQLPFQQKGTAKLEVS